MPERPRREHNVAGASAEVSLSWVHLEVAVVLTVSSGPEVWTSVAARGVSVATSGMRPLNEREVCLM